MGQSKHSLRQRQPNRPSTSTPDAPQPNPTRGVHAGERRKALRSRGLGGQCRGSQCAELRAKKGDGLGDRRTLCRC